MPFLMSRLQGPPAGCIIRAHSIPRRSVLFLHFFKRPPDTRRESSAAHAARAHVFRGVFLGPASAKRMKPVFFSQFRRPSHLILAAVAVVALGAVPAGWYLMNRAPAAQMLAFSEFLQKVDAGAVTKVTFGERAIDVVLRDGRAVQTIAPK